MEKAIKYRSMPVQVLLMVVTFCIYAVYWFYETNREMESYTKREEPVFLWTMLFGFPPFCLYSYYKNGELFERISPDMNRWVIFLLWIIFPPAVWVIIQLKLNKLAQLPQTSEVV